MNTDEATAAGIAGILGGSMVLIALIGIALVVLTIVARWKVFTKAGEAGWKSIIPIYSEYIEWKISWNKIMMFWVCIALIVGGYILAMTSGAFIIGAETEGAVNTGGFLGIVGIVLMIAGGVIALIQKYKLFKSFGKGALWFVLYIFFPNIVMLVLGLGSSEYVSPQD